MTDLKQQQADKTFFALCLWREARGESDEVKTAVAYVVMNRALHPAWWGYDIMSVLFRPMQFSSLTDPKDRQLINYPMSSDNSWIKCLEIAEDVYNGNAINPIGSANHYYDISIPAPKWAEESKFIVQLGRIRFYLL